VQSKGKVRVLRTSNEWVKLACLIFSGAVIATCSQSASQLPALAGNGTAQGNSLKSSAAATSLSPPTISPISQKALHGNIDYLANMLHGAGLDIESKALPTTITAVRMGSPAYFGGVSADDKLLSCDVQKDQLAITISRKGTIYALKLRTCSAVTEPTSPQKSSQSINMAATVPKLTESETQALKTSQFVILIDRSGSMDNKVTFSGPTKSEWCQDHIESFAQEAATIANKKLTLVPFRETFFVRRDCGPDDVRRAIERLPAGGATDIASPLSKVFDEYLAAGARGPLIVAVITDGVPTSGADIGDVIKKFTHSLSNPKQVKVIFFSIGGDSAGESLMTHLDNYLYGEGAKYDIVDSYRFDELQRLGMDKALLRSK
jgi:Mg-chelatase subunit ChlD